MTVTEFLRARIEEDEAAAKTCLEPANLVPYSDDRIPAIKPEEWGALVDNYLGGPMGKHCARHDPLRVLAECAAKREILGAAAKMASYPDRLCDPTLRSALNVFYEYAVFPMVAIYKHHPDYQQEWAL